MKNVVLKKHQSTALTNEEDRIEMYPYPLKRGDSQSPGNVK